MAKNAVDVTENAVAALEESALIYKSHRTHKRKFMACLYETLCAFSVCAANPERITPTQGLVSAREALFRRRRDAYMRHWGNAIAGEMTGQERRLAAELRMWAQANRARFRPKYRSMESAQIRRVMTPVARVIGFLALESGKVRMTAAQRNRVEDALAALKGRELRLRNIGFW